MRRLLIDEKDLQHILLKRKMFIGGSMVSAISLLIGGIHEIQDFQGNSWIAYGLLVLGIIMVGIAFWEGYKGMAYNHEKLEKEIVDLDQTAHHHSIVAIKDTFEEFSNRYLVYQDTDWHCRFFMNYPTQKDENENIRFLKQKISAALKIPCSDIELTKKAQALQQKYSTRHGEMRVYDHIFYEAHISQFPETLQQPAFSVDGISYYWMTLAEMKQDADIKEKNLDVVQEIEKHI